MRMEILIVGIISFLLGGGIGGFIGWNVAPKKIENIQNVQNYNYVDNINNSTQTSEQKQYMYLGTGYYMNSNITAQTNFSKSCYTNSNSVSYTN